MAKVWRFLGPRILALLGPLALYDLRSRIPSPTYPNFVKSLITTAFPTLIAWLQQRTSLLFNSLIQRIPRWRPERWTAEQFWGPCYYCAATSCKIPVHHPYRLPKYGYTTNLRTTSQIQPESCTVWWCDFWYHTLCLSLCSADYEGLANATVWICSTELFSFTDILEWSSWTILSFHVTWNRGTQRNISEYFGKHALPIHLLL